MGTTVTVVADADRHEVAVEAARATFGDWDARFSRFRPESELSLLNGGAGRWQTVSPPMLTVIDASLEAARVTDGLFDPTILVRLRDLGYDDDFGQLPIDRPAAPLRPWRAGRWSAIEIDRAAGRVRLPEGIELDFGGIAKGMAVDAAISELGRLGIGPAAVNAGGDLAVLGSADGGWPIAIDDADGATVVLHRGALATSSTMHRRWRVGGAPRHHLVDPRTGMAADSGVVSASIAAPTCRAAEVAAKAALLLGPDGAAVFILQRRLAGLLVMDDATTWRVGEWEAAA